MKKSFLCFALSAASFMLQLQAQQLGPAELKVAARIKSGHSEAVELLKTSANINSGSLNIEGVKKVGAIYAKELEKAGFVCTWISMPDSIKRAGHLVAERKGKKGKKLFLIGHLDTVFEPDMPFTPFTLINDSTATGQGVNDMKGGDVIMIKALQALHAEGLLDDVTITAYFTGDEERSGDPVSVSRGDFISRAKQHDIAIGFEGASGLNTIATARRGSSGWTLQVKAKTGHSSTIFKESSGYGAIYEAARIINEFRTTLSTEKYLTFNPGLFIGGSEMSYDPAKALVQQLEKITSFHLQLLLQETSVFLQNSRRKMPVKPCVRLFQKTSQVPVLQLFLKTVYLPWHQHLAMSPF
jgi:glutamate carboxypeptidase